MSNARTLALRSEAVWIAALAALAGAVWAGSSRAAAEPASVTDAATDNARRLLDEGREIFRFDTFGSEAFWGDKLHLHQALVRREKGGVGDGLTARQALGLGLKVDVDKLPKAVIDAIKGGTADLDSADTTFREFNLANKERTDLIVYLKSR